VPPPEIWKVFEAALKSRMVMLRADVVLRGFACNMIDQALDLGSGDHALDIAMYNSRTAIERVLAAQASEESYRATMDGSLKSRILQFALQFNDLDLFHTACCPVLEPTRRKSHDYPPQPSFFAWLRSHLMKKGPVTFAAIKDE